MVDVHVRVGLPARHDEVDEGLEGQFLLRPVMAPEGAERLRRIGWIPHAEQVFQPVLLRERVALDVEEQVAGIGLRQRAQPAIRLHRQELERRHRPVARHVLQARLLVEAGQRGIRHVRHLRQWLLQRGERGHGPDAAAAQPPSLVRAQRCDQAQMVRGRAPRRRRSAASGRPCSGVPVRVPVAAERRDHRTRWPPGSVPSRCGSRRGSRPGGGCPPGSRCRPARRASRRA